MELHHTPKNSGVVVNVIYLQHLSEDTINRRGIPWQEWPVPGKLRWKLLKLGEGTRMERRYLCDDLNTLLVSRMNHRAMKP
jgi:hypothetical protein